MKTPICDFVDKYLENDNIRLHMPGHKGVGSNMEAYDITEISGADSLYEANGIIAESEAIASDLFGADTFYSAEGSSLSIRAMLYLVSIYAKEHKKRPKILAGRNVHKSFISGAALLDIDVDWLLSRDESYLCCKITADEIAEHLKKSEELPTALYLTSPDYLGNTVDIKSISRVCRERGVLLIVDNAHGAYLNFLENSIHPIALGADMCCDSAHKTLPAITGAAYLHISRSAPQMLKSKAKSAMALFGSTSPSYLILESLDRLNPYLACKYKDELGSLIDSLEGLFSELRAHGFELIGDEPIKLTIAPKSYGYSGTEIARILESNGINPEFADPDFTVLMFSPHNTDNDIEALRRTLLSLPRKEPILSLPPKLSLPERVMSPREAVLSSSETVPVKEALNRTLATVTVGCPPAVPIVVSGEKISESALCAFEYYGIQTCTVVK